MHQDMHQDIMLMITYVMLRKVFMHNYCIVYYINIIISVCRLIIELPGCTFRTTILSSNELY